MNVSIKEILIFGIKKSDHHEIWVWCWTYKVALQSHAIYWGTSGLQVFGQVGISLHTTFIKNQKEDLDNEVITVKWVGHCFKRLPLRK